MGVLPVRRTHQNKQQTDADPIDNARREFLRKSVYAAYATPVLTAMLVEQASAASSSNPNCVDPVWAADHPLVCR